MRSFPDIRFRELLDRTTQVRQLLDDGPPEEALEQALALRQRAEQLGIDSPYLAWLAASALLRLERYEEGFAEILKAVRADPLSTNFQDLFTDLAWRLRVALADPDREDDDPSTPRLYQALQQSGESDVPSHLAMARHLAAAGRGADAERLLEAVLLVAPVSKDAWRARARLARTVSDHVAAERCEAALARIAIQDAPFDVKVAAAS